MTRHALCTLCVLGGFSLAAELFAAPPEAWYTPSKEDYTRPEYIDGWAAVSTARGTVEEVDFKLRVDENGQIVDSSLKDALGDLKLSVNSAIDLIDVTMKETAQNILDLERLDAQFVALGKNLNKVMSIDGMKITIGGKSYTLGINKSTLEGAIKSGSTVEYTDSDGLFSVADNASLQNVNGVLSVKGWYYQADNTKFWDYTAGEVMLRLNKGSTVGPIFMKYGGIDKKSLGTTSGGALELKGWSTASSDIMTPLGDALSGEDGTFAEYDVVVRNKSKGVGYVSVGSLQAGAPTDGESVATNYNGELSLYGWNGADSVAWSYPRKSGENTLEWVSLSEMVDGESLAVSASGESGEPKLEVKGASTYAGKHGSHYFGTAKDGAALGWHELPNVTTNAVEGDNVTIASTTVGDTKTLGLLGWPSGGSAPLYLANVGGALQYLPLTIPTDNWTNVWETLFAWLGDGALKTGEAVFETDSLYEFLKACGMVYGTQGADMHFSGSGNNVEASFRAPKTWADGATINLTDAGKYQIVNFASAPPCAAKLSSMLSAPSSADAVQHLFLAKNKADGTLHYVPIGDGVLSSPPVDGVTIVTNSASGAIVQGSLSLYGVLSAKEGYVPVKRGNGIAWEPCDGVVSPDGKSIVTNETGALTVNGFATAAAGSAAVKRNGRITWDESHGWTGSFSYRDGYIQEGCVMIGRKPVRVPGMAATDGEWRVKIDLATSTATLENESGFKNPDGAVSYIPVFTLSGGKITADYRGSFVVPVWE